MTHQSIAYSSTKSYFGTCGKLLLQQMQSLAKACSYYTSASSASPSCLIQSRLSHSAFISTTALCKQSRFSSSSSQQQQQQLRHLQVLSAANPKPKPKPKPFLSVLDRRAGFTTSSKTATMASSELTLISTKNAPAAGPYSQAVCAAGQIWVAGQVPVSPDGTLISGSIAEKTAQCCANVKAILEAAGSDISKVVRVGVFITDMANFAEMNAEYAKWFTHKPARSTVAVYQLPMGVPVEIEAIALL